MEQEGVLGDGYTNGYFGVFKTKARSLETPAGRQQFIRAVQSIHPTLSEVSAEMPGSSLHGVISFGKQLWGQLSRDEPDLQAASELQDFSPMSYGFASSQGDVYLHVFGGSVDSVFEGSRRCLLPFGAMGTLLEPLETVNGFRYRDSRDLTGFIDGTKNPNGDEKRRAAALRADGSSFVLAQRYVHNLAKWSTVPVSEQECVIGRTKPDSVELKPLPPSSHVRRVDVKDEGSKRSYKIVRHSLPYGVPGGDEGLFFTAYASQWSTLDTLLTSMTGGRDGIHDRLLEFTTPVTGSYFFAPSMDMIQRLH